MNDISWMLYWADVAPALAGFLCVLGALVCIFSLFCVFLGFTGFLGEESSFNILNENKGRDGYYARDAAEKAWAGALSPRFRKLWPVTVISFLIWGGSFFVPDKDTFYLIAASQTGEQALQTPEFKKARVVLNNWLDNQLKNEAVK